MSAAWLVIPSLFLVVTFAVFLIRESEKRTKAEAELDLYRSKVEIHYSHEVNMLTQTLRNSQNETAQYVRRSERYRKEIDQLEKKVFHLEQQLYEPPVEASQPARDWI